MTNHPQLTPVVQELADLMVEAAKSSPDLWKNIQALVAETLFNNRIGINFSSLPMVLPHRDKTVVGILRIEDALAAYNQRLLIDQTFWPCV